MADEGDLKMSDLSSGMNVVADAGFTCMGPGIKLVEKDEKMGFYVRCQEGKHFMDGQVGDDGRLIGFSRKK